MLEIQQRPTISDLVNAIANFTTLIDTCDPALGAAAIDMQPWPGHVTVANVRSALHLFRDCARAEIQRRNEAEVDSEDAEDADDAEDGGEGGEAGSVQGDEEEPLAPALPNPNPGGVMSVQYPPPPNFISHHCPPLPAPGHLSSPSWVCDCHTHQLAYCAIQLGGCCYDLMRDELTGAQSAAADGGGFNDTNRAPNNLQRKRVYRKVASELNCTVRTKLPECCMRAIRRAWPSGSGYYMGYKPH